MTQRASLTGISTGAPVVGATGHCYAEPLIHSSCGIAVRAEPVFKRGRLAQACLDIGALLIAFGFVIAIALSIPLSVFLYVVRIVLGPVRRPGQSGTTYRCLG